MRIQIKNGRVIDPASQFDQTTDLVLENLQGWLVEPDAAELEQGRLHALALGAKR